VPWPTNFPDTLATATTPTIEPSRVPFSVVVIHFPLKEPSMVFRSIIPLKLVQTGPEIGEAGSRARTRIKVYVLEFPKGTRYRTAVKRPLDSMPIEDATVLDDMILRAWQRILSVLKHYEVIYCAPFYMRKDQICLRDLVPTQSQVGKAQVDAIKTLLVPIVCVRHWGKYYILDGHARSLKALQLGLKSVDAMVLFPETPIDYGVAKTAKEMNLKSLKDIKAVD